MNFFTMFFFSVGVSQIDGFKRALEDYIKSNPGTSMDEQIHAFTAILQITEEEQLQHSQIISSLQEWLSLEFPCCQLHLFGSSVSGLAFSKESDLDIYLENPQSKNIFRFTLITYLFRLADNSLFLSTNQSDFILFYLY